jgi:hypothetical protein
MRIAAGCGILSCRDACKITTGVFADVDGVKG